MSARYNIIKLQLPERRVLYALLKPYMSRQLTSQHSNSCTRCEASSRIYKSQDSSATVLVECVLHMYFIIILLHRCIHLATVACFAFVHT